MGTRLRKVDAVIILCVVVFLFANLGAVGLGGRQKAKEILCLSNLGQLGKIFEAYTNDYDGAVPSGMTFENGRWTLRGYWLAALGKYYAKDRKILFCPSATKFRTGISAGEESECAAWRYMGSGSVPPSKFSDYLPPECLGPDGAAEGSYGMNGYIQNLPLELSDPWGMRNRQIDNVRIPGGNLIPVFADCMSSSGSWSYWGQPPVIEGAYGNVMWDSEDPKWCINRHKRGYTNIAFLDGSAKRTALKGLWKLHWNKLWAEDMAEAGEPDWSSGTGWMMDFPEE